ncbi:MAG: PQQ-binding-like beta-propeller repeat protein [Solirubrobacteraceae bacterium]|jgi:outer membrane protein assembly factor BamB|nr:PQQ-binding-like beta-propeller repeat protein [Solirubrobacteraceae bacterium]
MIPRTRKARLLVGGLAALIALTAGVLVYALANDRPADVSNPEVAFRAPAPAPPEPEPEPRDRSFEWPEYGFTRARTRDFPLAQPARPPFPQRWAVRGDELLEFGPVAGGSSLYLLKNNGALYAIKRRSGVVYWKKKLGHLAASSPAYWKGVLFLTILEGDKGSKQGRVVAFNVEYPRVRWSRTLPSRTETSPLVVGDTVYIGSENGTVYALRADDGRLRWTYKAAGAVKGGLAYEDGKLFLGDYGGRVHALSARSGRKIWSVTGGGGAFGLGGGRFYATPSVAFGRVYVGNTNGSMYSFSTANGALAWRKGTGDYIYSSAAVTSAAGIGPTVYVGSYDGTLYALNARTGDTRWTHRAEGRISGGIQLIGDLVFYSTLNGHTTALGAATGRQVWTVRKGKFNPVISDGRYLFLNGQTSLFAYDLRPGNGPVELEPGDTPELKPPKRDRARLARERQGG